MSQIEVVVNGAKGKMGSETVRAVSSSPNMVVVAETDQEDNLESVLEQHPGVVVVDFTHPDCAMDNAQTILKCGCRGVIGTTGFAAEQVQQLADTCQQKQLGMVIVPNFAIGAVLMMNFAAQSAPWMETCEIIEIHHPGKADSPSGTALSTARLVASSRQQYGHQPFPGLPPANESISGCRGGEWDGIRIHSLRTQGTIANQEVVFGALGQTLTIRHDTTSRAAFMPGVILACRKVVELEELVYGLDRLLFGN